MKGLFIVFGETYSGAEKVLCDYLCGQEDFDYVVYLINHNDFAVQSFKDRLGNSRVFDSTTDISLPFFSRNISQSFWKRKATELTSTVQQYAKNHGFDFLYANNTLETSLIDSSLSKDIPILFHVHDMISTLKSPIRRRVIIRNLSEARTVFVPSDACREELIKFGVSETAVVTLYNHIKFDGNQDRFKQVFEGNLNIGFVGALTKRKALDTLLTAVELLSSRYNFTRNSLKIRVAYHLLDKKYFRELSRLIKELDLSDRIDFQHNLSKLEIDRFYESCDFIVVPSRRDPLPTVVLEAISHGKIVIGSRIDGIPEMITESRLLFDVDDSQQLAKIMNEILLASSEERTAMFSNLYSHIVRQFSFENKRQVLMERLTGAKDQY